jgi:hypothetical protein
VRKLFRNIVLIFTIMSSSRSIAAARNRRAGDPVQQQQPPNRPGTSIGSSAAFQTQTQYGKKVPQQSQKSEAPPPSNPNVPFSKISISDAIGLITLRLGKVEQYIIDTQHDSESGNGSGSGGGGGGFSLPENTQLVDNSVFTSIINRLDSIEKKELQSKQLLTKIEQELSALNNKLNQYTIDTNTRLDDINDAFLILEEGQGKVQTDDQVQLQTEEDDQGHADETTLEETAIEVPLNTNGD